MAQMPLMTIKFADLMFWEQSTSVERFLNQITQRYAYNSIIQVSEKQDFQFVQTENSQNGSTVLPR